MKMWKVNVKSHWNVLSMRLQYGTEEFASQTETMELLVRRAGEQIWLLT